MNGSRLRGALPKVGIRPTIDGRYGGVRESLEGHVMNMARRAAELIERESRHSCGAKVETVLADACIGGFAESAQCEDKFSRADVGLTLTVTPCWCYGAETIDLHPTRPTAIWGFNGTERPGAVYLAAALAAHAQKGVPAFGIYGSDVQDASDTEIPPDARDKILRFVKAGLAVATMRGKAYLAIGGASMGIAGSIVDQDFFEQFLGMRVESVDMSEMAGRMRRRMYDEQEFDRALEWTRRNCREGSDSNGSNQRTREQKDDDWRDSVKMALIAKDLMVGNPRLAQLGFPEQAQGHNAIAGGFQGQREWTDHYPNGDFMEAILSSSFDWDGVREPSVFATENDSLNAASMLLGNLMTGAAQLFSDVRTYWSPESVKRVAGYDLEGNAALGILHLINSGPSALDWTGRQRNSQGSPTVKPFWEVSAEEAQSCLDATLWRPSVIEYFPGGGWSTDFTTLGGIPCTMCRINLVKGLGPVLQIAEGVTVDLPEPVHQILDERTNPTWPTTWFAPRLTGSPPFESVYSVMSAWGANHGAISSGHIGADLLSVASMLRIPVDMHNVPSKAFRPAVWDRFGAMEPQAADFRACAALGPLYG